MLRVLGCPVGSAGERLGSAGEKTPRNTPFMSTLPKTNIAMENPPF